MRSGNIGTQGKAARYFKPDEFY